MNVSDDTWGFVRPTKPVARQPQTQCINPWADPPRLAVSSGWLHN